MSETEVVASGAAGDAGIGIYVHWPFCRVRCTYCPFAITTEHSLETAYVEALLREIALGKSQPAVVETIFFGGGTPSRSPVTALEKVTEQLARSYRLELLEFSIEANPEDVSAEIVKAWTAFGINRISIGVQSLHDDELRPLGRIHGRERALEAIGEAIASGARVSADLILGLPGQTVGSYLETLETTLATGIGHLSVYMLDLEEGTTLFRQVELGKVSLPDDSIVGELYRRTIETAAGAGLTQYEVSNFARAGEECLHNLRYWTRRRYDGFGAGAHSFDGARLRTGNVRDIAGYISKVTTGDGSAVEMVDPLGEIEERREQIFLSLRQAKGIEYSRLRELCGEEADRWKLEGLREGWIREKDGRVMLTPAGYLVSNDLLSALF